MNYAFHTLDVFTDRTFGGNPLAVFPDARGLTDAQMQHIAMEFNLSETTFLLPPESGGTRRVRIFTPRRELPFAGHPTVGSAFLLAAIGAVPLTDGSATIVLEEGVGPVSVAVRGQSGRPVYAELTAAQLPEQGPPAPSREKLASVVGLGVDDIIEKPRGPAAYSCGLRFLMVPLRDRDALRRAQLNVQRWQETIADYWALDVFLIVTDPDPSASGVRARMFAPAAGIVEDPATGSAVAALAGFLAPTATIKDGTAKWTIEQGVEMGRPSLLHLEADLKGGAVTGVRVGGGCVLVSQGTIEVPG